MSWKIVQLHEPNEKRRAAREILESLTHWFEVPETREEYIAKSADQPFWCACDGNRNIGFLYLYETGRDTVELCVMGVRQEYHRKGVGRALFLAAYEAAREMGYSFLQVKTVQMGKYADYDATNRFYLSLGFKEFEVFPTLWDEQNPCQLYVMALR